LGCHQVFLSTKTGLLSWRTCVNPLCGLEVQYPKVKTFRDISSIVDHLLPHLQIQVIKRISFFSSQGSGPLVLQKGFFKGHNPLGLSPTLSFDQDLFPVSLIIAILWEVQLSLGFHPVSLTNLSIVLHPVCFVIDYSVQIPICQVVY